jgi:hypothetical protein
MGLVQSQNEIRLKLQLMLLGVGLVGLDPLLVFGSLSEAMPLLGGCLCTVSLIGIVGLHFFFGLLWQGFAAPGFARLIGRGVLGFEVDCRRRRCQILISM